ncbi:hypothetical protein RM574_25575 [Streptomyces sp. DSM 41982]|uniref:Uncharacterized protein n=1 Tax=Streptomyces evansiae TaxID=3075535 RepID=A0ABD5EBM8_9ACTN|nr:hypothetical protein [Streptomyces sp. DSM 41982]MDT0418855.1 hypothetical protein [Streptomyces sp. DSM 41982]
MVSRPEVEVELHGGPLDGWRVPVDPTDPDPWTAILSDHGQHPGGRSLYAPDAAGAWRWVRDLRWDEL